jgi:hypothetical protein
MSLFRREPVLNLAIALLTVGALAGCSTASPEDSYLKLLADSGVATGADPDRLVHLGYSICDLANDGYSTDVEITGALMDGGASPLEAAAVYAAATTALC